MKVKVFILLFILVGMQSVLQASLENNEACRQSLFLSSKEGLPQSSGQHSLPNAEAFIAEVESLMLSTVPHDSTYVESGSRPWLISPALAPTLIAEKRSELEKVFGADETQKLFLEAQHRVHRRLRERITRLIHLEDVDLSPIRPRNHSIVAHLHPRMVLTLDHVGEVLNAEFNPAGTQILSVSAGSPPTVWDVKSGQPLFSLKVPNTQANTQGADPLEGSLAHFSNRGNLILTWGGDLIPRIWDAHTGKLLKTMDPLGHDHKGSTNDASFSPDSRYFVTVSSDQMAKVWDIESGQWAFDLIQDPLSPRAHNKAIWSVAYSPDGRFILTAGADNYIKLWDSQSGAWMRDLSIPNPIIPKPIFARFNKNGEQAWVGTFKGVFQKWDLNEKGLLWQLDQQLAHNGLIQAVEESPDGQLVLSGGTDGIIKLWRTRVENILLIEIDGGTRLLAAHFSADGSKVIGSFADGSAKVWELYEKMPISVDL